MKYEINKLSIEEKIGQMIIIGIDTKESVKDLEEIIKKYKVGGVLLYKKVYKNYEEMIDLINHIKELNKENQIPMFIAIDQEGGRVNRMPNEFKNLPEAYRLAKNTTDKEDLVSQAGEITGEMLNKTGINFNFAPVLDIKRFKNKHAIGDRAFSESAEEVSKYGIKYMKKLQNNNIITIVKHFPGHGLTKDDSHFILPKISCEFEKIEQEDIIPFKLAMKNKADGILVSHLRINQISKKLPLSMCKKFITQYIRKECRYNGLIVTDDMRMKAVKIRFGKNRAIEKAFLSCNDIIVFKYDGNIDVINRIVMLAKTHMLKEKRINKSVLRILKVKDKYNLNNDAISIQEGFIDNINSRIEYIRDKTIL